MLKKSFWFIVLAGIAFMITGCGGKNIVIKKDVSELTADKSKAYVVFSRPSILFGMDAGLVALDIIHFDNKSFKTELVSNLPLGEQVIYPIEEGKNYFYITSNSMMDHIFDNIQMIDAKKGSIYYISLGFSPEISPIGIYAPKLYSEKRELFIENLKKENCNSSFLNRYLFKKQLEHEETEISLVPAAKVSPIIKYTSPIYINLSCQDGKIVQIKDRYLNYGLEELKKPSLVTPTQDAMMSFKKDEDEHKANIKQFYQIWNERFRNIPIVPEAFLDVTQTIDDDNFKKYSKVNIVALADNKVEKNIIDEITRLFQSKLNGSNDGRTLTLKYHVNTFTEVDRWSMLKDGITLFGSIKAKRDVQSNVGTTSMDVEFINEQDKQIGSLSISGLRWGLGIDVTKEDIVNIVSEYTINNLIK